MQPAALEGEPEEIRMGGWGLGGANQRPTLSLELEAWKSIDRELEKY